MSLRLGSFEGQLSALSRTGVFSFHLILQLLCIFDKQYWSSHFNSLKKKKVNLKRRKLVNRIDLESLPGCAENYDSDMRQSVYRRERGMKK